MNTFNLKEIKETIGKKNRYERQISRLENAKRETKWIKHTVEESITNLESGKKSFVIYGEPQSGKTEMMICLTSKLLDYGYKIIVILLNDSIQLLNQNLERFHRSGLDPAPKKFNEILLPNIKIGGNTWVIFCKKNQNDLRKLITKLDGHGQRVIIDDEADYATPNSKINANEKSRINELTEKLIGYDGIYIGVTATPARLDLNNTHKNRNENWIDFPAHSYYTGQDKFFPTRLEQLPYKLTLLSDSYDGPQYLREALFRFMVNVAFLNTEINDPEENYSILIHTSGKKADHTVDYDEVIKIFEILSNEEEKKHEKYYEMIWKIANEIYPGYENQLVKYILENNTRNNIVVMNSDKEINAADNKTATLPSNPFTIIIGGNIVSRGVTFENLLSMFFTRDVKHKMQQDTYIQRARMFGSREHYLKYFELTIPASLFLNWQMCFIFHRLSLESRRTRNGTPIWLEGGKITAVAGSSIDHTTVVLDSGEMSFELFDFNETLVNQIIDMNINELDKIKKLAKTLGEKRLPNYLVRYIESFMPEDDSVVLHKPMSIMGRQSDTNHALIFRPKGFIGQYELKNYPKAIHHVFILFNDKNKARVFYKYEGNIHFLKKDLANKLNAQ